MKKEGSRGVNITARIAKRRKMNPTTSKLSIKSKLIRRKETMQACIAIHGGTKENPEAAINGMIQTLNSSCTSKDLSKKIMESKTSTVNSIKHKVLRSWSKEYYLSNENCLRSLNVYYSHNVLGKRKYLSIRKANNNSSLQNVDVVNYIPYNLLSKEINQVDVGAIFPVSELDNDNEVVQGLYRNPAEYVLRLASFYLCVNENRVDKLKCFDSIIKKNYDSVLFVMSIGGDGAPISGMSILISFLNVGK